MRCGPLTLFALGRYPEAAATLNAVLATAPGMDWTTMSNLYGSVDTYTAQLRRLEDFCRSHRDDAAAHFVLAYHYLVAGHPEAGRRMPSRWSWPSSPAIVVAKQILESIRPPEPATQPSPAVTRRAQAIAEPDTPPASSAPETDLVGTLEGDQRQGRRASSRSPPNPPFTGRPPRGAADGRTLGHDRNRCRRHQARQ